MQVKACLNGARDVASHPRLRPDPALLAREAASAVAAGAFAVHLHPKAADGSDSLAADDVDRFVRAARAAVDVPIGVTTGAWTGAAARARRRRRGRAVERGRARTMDALAGQVGVPARARGDPGRRGSGRRPPPCERATWPAIDAAIAWGLPTRAGLEDSLTLPDGTVADDTAALVRAVLQRAASAPGRG